MRVTALDRRGPDAYLFPRLRRGSDCLVRERHTHKKIKSLSHRKWTDRRGPCTDDPVGNLLSTVNTTPTSSTTTTDTYNAANELCWSLNATSGNACNKAPHAATTYSYDADGNQTTDSASTLAYAYNGLNQTTSITPSGGTSLTMAYRGSAQADRASAGSTAFINSELGVISATSGTSTTYYTRDPDGNLVSERTPNGTYYYLPDGLGSTVGLTDSNGLPVDTYAYDPYGNTTSSTGTVTNPWRYAGAYQDSTTGLYKMGERYYNPALARWSQQDTVIRWTNPQGDDRYVYAFSDPANLIDASGLSPTGSIWDTANDYGTACVQGAAVGGVAGAETGPFDAGAAGAGCVGGTAVKLAGDLYGHTVGKILDVGSTLNDIGDFIGHHFYP